MKVFTYIRVSGKSQIEGDGPERQRDAMLKFCQDHKLLVTGEWFERGVSGTVEGMDRPEFSEMISYVDARKGSPDAVGAIIVERVDRLARDLMVSEVLLGECRKRGLKVFAADQGALIDMASDGEDPTRKLIRQIMAALAEWEKSQLVKKLRLARQRMREKTGRCEGPKLMQHPAIDLMIRFRKQGFSYKQIEKFLQDGDIKNSKGHHWKASKIHELLTARGKN